MAKYIALLRGINVGGNNKISMPELKTAFEKNDFTKVVTYINSGNVIFESNLNKTEIKTICEKLIDIIFGLKIAVCIISSAELIEALNNAPKWWNQGNAKHNAIFVIPPVSIKQVIAYIGEIKPEYESLANYGKVIFWSAPLETFSKTRLTQAIKNKAFNNAITIRNANTTVKISKM